MSDEKGQFSTSELARCRWNVLDMINVIGKGAVATYMFADIDMSWAEQLRKKLHEQGKKVTVTAILLKAIAVAQRTHPASRTALLPFGKTVIFHDIVAGFTVERFVGSQPAVFFGAIKGPDTKPLEEIARELKEYAEQEFEDVHHLNQQNWFNNTPWLFRQLILWLGLRIPPIRLKYMDATFGLSSLGKFGAKVLIPPCVSTSTFGIGCVEDRPVVVEGKIDIRPMLTIALNFDHRVIDGAPAARFLQDVCALMEGGLETHLQADETAALSPSYSS